MNSHISSSSGARGLLLAAIFVSGAGLGLRAQEGPAVIYDGRGAQPAIRQQYPPGTQVVHRVRTIVYPDGRVRRIVDPTPVRITPPPQQVQARAQVTVRSEPRPAGQRGQAFGAVITDQYGTQIVVAPTTRVPSETYASQESDSTATASAKPTHALRFDAEGNPIPDLNSTALQTNGRSVNMSDADDERVTANASSADPSIALIHSNTLSSQAIRNSAASPSTSFRTDSEAPSSPPKKDVNLTPHPETKNYPTATRSSKYGFVKSPYAPYNELDATGLSSGSLARDPSTGKIFKMP